MLWDDSSLAVRTVEMLFMELIDKFAAKGGSDSNTKNELSRNGKSETTKKKEQ